MQTANQGRLQTATERPPRLVFFSEARFIQFGSGRHQAGLGDWGAGVARDAPSLLVVWSPRLIGGTERTTSWKWGTQPCGAVIKTADLGSRWRRLTTAAEAPGDERQGGELTMAQKPSSQNHDANSHLIPKVWSQGEFEGHGPLARGAGTPKSAWKRQ